MIKLDSSLPHIMTKFELGADITPIQRKFPQDLRILTL